MAQLLGSRLLGRSPARSTAQQQYLSGYLNTFYSVLTGAQWKNPTTGYAAYLDVAEALNHHIQGVVTFNVDALRLSGYLYKPRNGKILMGPVWDFDRTQGSTDGRDFNPRRWRSTVPDCMARTCSIRGIPMRTRGTAGCFRTSISGNAGWTATRNCATMSSAPRIHALIDALASEVRLEQPREMVRWGIRPRPGAVSSVGYTYQFPGTYQGEVDWMKHWYSERLDFIGTPGAANPTYGFMNWYLNTDGKPVPAAPPSSVMFAGAGQNIIYIDWDHDLVAVARWIRGGPTLGEFFGKLLAAVR